MAISTDAHYSFPEDLFLDILLRLPVESLVRFKCVCKNWYALIKSPSFIRKHFQHKNNRVHLLICSSSLFYESNLALNSVAFSLLPSKIVPGVTPVHKNIHHLQRVRDFTCVAGPVDGIFLVQKAFYGDDVRLALWNPATREFRSLPPAHFDRRPSFTDHDHQFGLGFDLLTQDYKVVWIRVFWDELTQGVFPRVFASVYSLRNDSWKILRPEFPSSCSLSESLDATYLNGVYYWLSKGLDEIYSIRSFDMGNEQFGEIQAPDISSEQWGTLTLRGDSLALLTGAMTNFYNVWVMIEEGRWTKVLTVQPLLDIHWPRALCENDNMILEISNTSRLVLYDHTTDEVTDLGFQLDLSFGRCWVFNYKESLVPIKRGNDEQDQDNVVELIDHFFSSL